MALIKEQTRDETVHWLGMGTAGRERGVSKGGS